MAWRFHEHILRGELDNTVRGRVTGRIWLAGIAEPMTLELRGDCAPDLAGCTLTFENPKPVPFPDEYRPALAQRGWVDEITSARRFKVPDVPIEEFVRMENGPWHWANTLSLVWNSTTNGEICLRMSDFKLTISAHAWTLTPDEFTASREASGREFIEWSKAEFGWTAEDISKVEVVNVADLAREEGEEWKSDDDEGEEWKRADDDPGAADDDAMLVFDPFDDADWRPGRVLLAKYGFTPLRTAEVSDEHLRGRLWELIYALAGRRIFLHWTNHLDDRALYAKLDAWLDEDCADCPLATGMNCRVDMSEAGSGTDEGTDLWLRHYADEETRAQWERDFPECPMPPREKPPHDRDRWLPEPPRPRVAWSPGGEDDPLGLAEVDREIRIEQLKQEIADAAGGEMHETKLADVPRAIEEAYLGQVRDIERDGWQRPVDALARSGAAPLPPGELTDEALTPRLWELLHQLACRGFYVQQSDHLSDRALYEKLWEKGLREEGILPGRSRTAGFFHDILGSYGEEELEIFHRYYQGENDRARTLAEFPHSKLPPREQPPYSRDWRLPQGPFC